ncbi:MAG: hypothetical protein ACFFB3_06580 [Candidatus Hodarchaeota archaeon]
MAKAQKFTSTKKMEAELVFKHLDPYMARFGIDRMPGFLSKKVLEIDPKELFPADFDTAKYNATGKITITVNVTEK